VVDENKSAAPLTQDHPLAPGTSAGRYVVLDRLAVGGMGFVYTAYDPDLDRKIALKILRPDRHSSEAETHKAQARLLREARVLARLQHPNVVPIYDVGTLQGQIFIAMAFVGGEDLEHWMRREERSWELVLDNFIAAGHGLAAAHAAGLVHRDFKPANVMLGKDGQVRVVDFGLARRYSLLPVGATEGGLEPGAGPTIETDLLQTITKTGAVLGTPAYMAPEQHQRETPDARTDQFAFCVALYEALYGERPFEGTNLRETQLRVLVGELRETPYNSTVPLWLRTVLLRGLETSPNDRYPSMDALLKDLKQDPNQASHRKRNFARALGMVSVGLLFGFGMAFLAPITSPPNTTEPMAKPPTFPGLMEKKILAQINEMVAKQTSATEAELRAVYDKKLAELRQLLEVAQRQSEERFRIAQDFRTPGNQPSEKSAETPDLSIRGTASAPPESAGESPDPPELVESPASPPTSPKPGFIPHEPPATLSSLASSNVTQLPPPEAPSVEPGDLVDLDSGVVPPQVVRPLQPLFPPMAKHFHRKEATVRIRLLIDEHGKVLKAELIGRKQGYGFDEEALRSAKKSTYKPATKGGVPVKVWKTLTVEFRER
jgi:TonB family protein